MFVALQTVPCDLNRGGAEQVTVARRMICSVLSQALVLTALCGPRREPHVQFVDVPSLAAKPYILQLCICLKHPLACSAAIIYE